MNPKLIVENAQKRGRLRARFRTFLSTRTHTIPCPHLKRHKSVKLDVLYTSIKSVTVSLEKLQYQNTLFALNLHKSNCNMP